MSSPGLTKTSEAKSRSIGKRSAAVRPGDPVLPALVAHCVSFGLLFAMVPGSRDGLSVHTVRDDSWRETGNGCGMALCPPNPQRSAFLRKSRNRGPQGITPVLYFIGAPPSSPHECVCHPSVLTRPSWKHLSCAVRPDSSGGRCRVARSSKVSNSFTRTFRPRAVLRARLRTLRLTTGAFAPPLTGSLAPTFHEQQVTRTIVHNRINVNTVLCSTKCRP
jgi:hypothetical protein